MTQGDPQLRADEKTFPLEFCPTCGYSLNGLPTEGICPECGNPYDDSQIVIYGWACGRHANASNSRGRSFVLAWVPFFGFWQLAQPGLSNTWRLGLLGLWVAAIAYSLMRRNQTDHPGGVQLRLDRNGIAQLDDLSGLRSRPGIHPKRFTPWRKLTVDTWKPRGSDRFRVRLKLIYPWYKPLSEPYPVDADIQCSPEVAARLRRVIEAWGAK